ncbi:MAG: oligoendopeptidase family [Gemmatimonadetes bacterium]|nr:oligoendopeptidase family [Gemmatimonadota bacterium]
MADYLIPLPAGPADLAAADWPQMNSWYDALATAGLTPATVDRWLATWSRLDELVTEAASRAMIAYTCDTSDPAKEQAHLRFSAEIMPKAEEQGVRLARRLVDSGLAPAGLETTLERFRTAIEIFREANVPLFSELEELGAAYQRTTGSMTADWEGERRPLPQLSPFLQSPDRPVRERAWRATLQPYLDTRQVLAELFDRMYLLRQQVARNAGFASFRDYSFKAKFRFDYGPQDCLRFHDAVEETVVPALRRVLHDRRARLGLERLRPWDLAVNPYRTETLRPYREPAELPRVAARIFDRVDPMLGAEFQLMIDEGLLDLESRQGKAPGGYCDTLHATGRPFIFMNASGVMDDVNTLLHEAGHAFHAFASHSQPLIWQRHPGSESAELASMSMELLANRYLARPAGYLEELDARRARLEHLEDVLASLAHIASVDAFQHWIYASGEGQDAAARDAEWIRIRRRFDPEVDWTGLEAERVARWYRQLHIFLYPFYYIEYGIAQLGALQVWRNAQRDQAAATRAYRAFLALGATRSLPDLYGAAGARLIFDAGGMADLVAAVEREIESLRAGLAGAPEVARG